MRAKEKFRRFVVDGFEPDSLANVENLIRFEATDRASRKFDVDRSSIGRDLPQERLDRFP